MLLIARPDRCAIDFADNLPETLYILTGDAAPAHHDLIVYLTDSTGGCLPTLLGEDNIEFKTLDKLDSTHLPSPAQQMLY